MAGIATMAAASSKRRRHQHVASIIGSIIPDRREELFHYPALPLTACAAVGTDNAVDAVCLRIPQHLRDLLTPHRG